jgi:hypothetical protein
LFHRSSFRVLAALSLAIGSLGAIAGPAAAETPIDPCTGTCGYYEIGDSGPPYGANCSYERGSKDLDKMSVRPPLMHGNYDFDTTVKWRFKVIRQAPGGALSLFYTSRYQNAQANNMTPARAGHGFSRRVWTAPENFSGRAKIWLEMFWVGSAGVPGGAARVELDYYKMIWNGTAAYVMEDCPQDY